MSTNPHPTTITSLENDVLSCVRRFVIDHCYDKFTDKLPQLRPEQVIRGRQALANRLRENEYCVITVITQERKGTAIHDYEPNKNDNDGKLTLIQTVLSSVQIDFYNHSAKAGYDPANERANIAASYANSTECAKIFHGYNPLISCMYSDEPITFPEVDDSHQITQRTSITLHLCESKGHSLPMHFIDYCYTQSTNVDTLPDKEV